MIPINDLVRQCEDLVRAGKIDQAQRLLSELETAKLPRSLRLPLANLCRRTDLLRLGLKILSPLVHTNKKQWQTIATPQELSEYAVLLQKHGAIREALWTLNHVDEKTVPEAALYKAFCHFSYWDFESAIECLERHSSLETRPYQRLTGRVNLCMALVSAGHLERAHEVLNELMAAAEQGSFARLHANCLELRAQVYLKSGDMEAAKGALAKALTVVSSNPALDHSLIKKWTAIIDGLETKNIAPLIQFREEAVLGGQWENVREADRFLLKIKFDESLFDNLMFGTPYPKYRAALQKEFGRLPAKPFLMIGSATGPLLDLSSGEFEAAAFSRPSQKVHSLIEILLRDFYRPVAIGGLFAELFSGEYFDPQSSVHRVHQLIYRTRGWIEENKLPIEIKEIDGKYSLCITGALRIRVPYERMRVQTEVMRLESLRAHFGGGRFGSRDACEVLGISSTTFKSWINWALSESRVVRMGSGSRTCYLISQSEIVIRKSA
jgi:tetratricopeptide (TPR) repeat protein